MTGESQRDSDPLYTDAQLSKYQRLIRQATRWLFSGDVTERLDTAANADDAFGSMRPKRKVTKVQFILALWNPMTVKCTSHSFMLCCHCLFDM